MGDETLTDKGKTVRTAFDLLQEYEKPGTQFVLLAHAADLEEGIDRKTMPMGVIIHRVEGAPRGQAILMTQQDFERLMSEAGANLDEIAKRAYTLEGLE